jgi:hypothetical protein
LKAAQERVVYLMTSTSVSDLLSRQPAGVFASGASRMEPGEIRAAVAWLPITDTRPDPDAF